MSLFGWNIPYVAITASLFGLFLLALALAPFSKFWESVCFKTAVSGLWALVTLWAISGLIHLLRQ